jgi:hypothetical protein
MTSIDITDRDKVEIVLWQVFPMMRDISERANSLTETQVAHIAWFFRRTETSITYTEEDVIEAFDAILKWRVQ